MVLGLFVQGQNVLKDFQGFESLIPGAVTWLGHASVFGDAEKATTAVPF